MTKLNYKISEVEINAYGDVHYRGSYRRPKAAPRTKKKTARYCPSHDYGNMQGYGLACINGTARVNGFNKWVNAYRIPLRIEMLAGKKPELIQVSINH